MSGCAQDYTGLGRCMRGMCGMLLADLFTCCVRHAHHQPLQRSRLPPASSGLPPWRVKTPLCAEHFPHLLLLLQRRSCIIGAAPSTCQTPVLLLNIYPSSCCLLQRRSCRPRWRRCASSTPRWATGWSRSRAWCCSSGGRLFSQLLSCFCFGASERCPCVAGASSLWCCGSHGSIPPHSARILGSYPYTRWPDNHCGTWPVLLPLPLLLLPLLLSPPALRAPPPPHPPTHPPHPPTHPHSQEGERRAAQGDERAGDQEPHAGGQPAAAGG